MTGSLVAQTSTSLNCVPLGNFLSLSKWRIFQQGQHGKRTCLTCFFSSTETDIKDFRLCVRLTREIFAQKALAPFRGKELQPGSHVQSDAEIDAFVRAKADSAYHPSCTCKMGQPSDPTAVVDPQTRVLGVENLRVVDASIMPSVVSGNLNAPTIMIAEKAADIIQGRPALWDEGVPVYKPRTLATQR